MPESPFVELPPEEQRLLLERCMAGEEFVFAGEKYTVPSSLSKSHLGIGSRLYEVSEEELLSVAAQISTPDQPIGKTVERAYSLICESKVFARNLKHWNEKSKRNHVSQLIHDLVRKNTVLEGQVPRNELLAALLNAKGKANNLTDTRKLFNRWVRQSLRHRSFSEVIPWHPNRDDFDEKLNRQLYDKGWIRQIRIGSAIHYAVPEKSSAPNHKPRRKLKDGEHITRPWWNTKNVWWPNPSPSEVKEFKAQYLNGKGSCFRNEYLAKQALTKLERWLEIEEAAKEKLK